MLRDWGRWEVTEAGPTVTCMGQWVWCSPKETKIVLDSLVRRGLADVVVLPKEFGVTRYVYAPVVKEKIGAG